MSAIEVGQWKLRHWDDHLFPWRFCSDGVFWRARTCNDPSSPQPSAAEGSMASMASRHVNGVNG